MNLFFEQADQRGIPNTTIIQLQAKGITTIEYLVDVDKDLLQQLTDNLHCPRGRIPNPNPPAVARVTILMPAFIFAGKSKH